MEHSRSASKILPIEHEDDEASKSEERDEVLEIEDAQKVIIDPAISAQFQ